MRETLRARLRLTVAAGLIKRFVRDASGATAVEYALLASGVAIVIAVSVDEVGGHVGDLYAMIAGTGF